MFAAATSLRNTPEQACCVFCLISSLIMIDQSLTSTGSVLDALVHSLCLYCLHLHDLRASSILCRGLVIRRKDSLQDTARDSGDDSPLGRRSSSRRLGSLHSAEQARLGSSTPAMALPQPQRGSTSPLAHGPPGGEKVMLYFGIIDFLQVGCHPTTASWV